MNSFNKLTNYEEDEIDDVLIERTQTHCNTWNKTFKLVGHKVVCSECNGISFGIAG